MNRLHCQRLIDLALWDALSVALIKLGCKFPSKYVWIGQRKLKTKNVKTVTVQFFEPEAKEPKEVYTVFSFKKTPLVGLVSRAGAFVIYDLI